MRRKPAAERVIEAVCGDRVKTIEDQVLKPVHQPGKRIDELAKGKSLEKIKEGCHNEVSIRFI